MPNGEISRGLNLYFQGVKDGLETYNEQLIVEGKTPLFCLPSTAISVDQAENIMKTKAEKLAKVANMDSMQISILLLEGSACSPMCDRS